MPICSDVPTTAFRFFTVYGPWGRPDMALFKFVSAILKGEPIEIYGDGRMSRDFTYVDDLVEAIRGWSNVVPSELNRVDGVDTLSRRRRSHRQYRRRPAGRTDALRRDDRGGAGPAGDPHLLPMQPGDVPRTFAPRLLEALTGYKPSTPVETGVARFVDWYRDYTGA